MNYPLNIPNSIIVKVDLTTIGAGDAFELKASQQMKGKNVTHICAITESEMLTYKGDTPVAANGLPSLSLTLFLAENANTTKYDQMPTAFLAFNNSVESKGLVSLNGRSIDWDQSKVNVLAGTNLTAGECFLLLCIYE